MQRQYSVRRIPDEQLMHDEWPVSRGMTRVEDSDYITRGRGSINHHYNAYGIDIPTLASILSLIEEYAAEVEPELLDGLNNLNDVSLFILLSPLSIKT